MGEEGDGGGGGGDFFKGSFCLVLDIEWQFCMSVIATLRKTSSPCAARNS